MNYAETCDERNGLWRKDDGYEKTFEQLLDYSDVEDMFRLSYCRQDTPVYQSDAGRSRCDAFFKKMYGSSAEEVKHNLVTVDWFGGKVKFTKINGAAEQLKKVAAELAQHPELAPYLPSAGTFYWRQVRGANRLSAHSYGMTIDIGGNYKTYWLWAKPGAKETDNVPYKNKMPHEIVEIFENFVASICVNILIIKIEVEEFSCFSTFIIFLIIFKRSFAIRFNISITEIMLDIANLACIRKRIFNAH